MRESIGYLFQLAINHHNAGKLADAEKLYRQILARDPNHADALHLLGVIGARIGQYTDAIELLRRAISLRPSDSGFHNDLGNCLRDAMLLEEAVAVYREAIRLMPDNLLAWNNLANAQCDLGLTDEGIAAYRRLLRCNPNFAGVHNNLGRALRDINFVDEAIASFERAIQLQPDLAEAHHNLSLVLLLKGDFAQAWPEHEWRLRLEKPTSARPEFAQPAWDGAELHGKTILLHTEQGLGDSIQFMRYIYMVHDRGGKVILQCQPALSRLFTRLCGIDGVINDGDPIPHVDAHCPLLSLPRAFDTTLDSIPASVPYLTADPVAAADWAKRLADRPGKKVGIVWAGSPGFVSDRLRSLSLTALPPLASAAGITWYSLQKGQAAARISDAPQSMKLIDCTAELNDFADTAALIANLDLVISVDTAVAHLAGAMGKPVWTLLPYAPDWRWLLNRDDSPWYPTMRLFRQQRPGDWDDVIQRVAEAL